MRVDRSLIQIALLGPLALLGYASSVLAADGALSPYIDSIRQNLPPESGSQGYTDQIRSKLPPEPASEGYTEKLRKENPALLPQHEQGSFTEKQKAALPPKPEGGAIEAVHEGRSQLRPRYEGQPNQIFGFRYVTVATRNITGSPGVAAANFSDLYGGNYVPELTLFYEYRPFRGEKYGNLGFGAHLGAAYFNGMGQFAFTLAKPAGVGTGNFPSQSLTSFQFFMVPAILTLDYRFTLSRYVRPFVTAGPSVIGYFEQRNDGVGNTYSGNSRALYGSVGTSILMDWMDPSARWESYSANEIHHTYLTVEYSWLNSFSGAVSFANAGLNAGILFEF